MENANFVEEDDDEDLKLQPCPKIMDVRQALDVLCEHMMFSEVGHEIHQNINHINIVFENEVLTSLMDFFA